MGRPPAGDGNPASATFNQKLSERRLAITRGIVGNHAAVTSSQAKGFTRLQAASRTAYETDRVAEITGKSSGGDGAVTISATIVRPKRPAGAPPGVGQPASGQPTSGQLGGPALASFRLRFVHQDERKILKFNYDSRKPPLPRRDSSRRCSRISRRDTVTLSKSTSTTRSSGNSKLTSRPPPISPRSACTPPI